MKTRRGILLSLRGGYSKGGYPPGSLYVSGKLPTYPSPKPTFSPKWEVSVNVGLGEG